MNIKFLLGSILFLPFLPVMLIQAIRIRRNVPELPEATGNEGIIKTNSKNKFALMVIGESTMAGVGVKTHQEGFTGSLAKELSQKLNTDVSWKVYAKSGFTAKDVTQNILPNISENHVDLIAIGLGANDAFKINRPKKWKTDLSTLIHQLRKKFPETPIVFCNMPPIKEFPAFTPLIKLSVGNLIQILGEELKELVKGQPNVYFSDEVITFDKWIHKLENPIKTEDFFSDGVHPSKLTYQIWAKDFAEFIENNVELGVKYSPRI